MFLALCGQTGGSDSTCNTSISQGCVCGNRLWRWQRLIHR